MARHCRTLLLLAVAVACVLGARSDFVNIGNTGFGDSIDVQSAALQTGAIANFPFCGCATKPNLGAYIATPVAAYGGGKYCFKISTQACSGPCCNVDLRKIEINVYDSCIVQPLPDIRTTVNGVPTRVGAALFRPRDAPPGGAVLRLTQLGLNLTTAAGAEVCITLGANRLGQGCTTLENLCKPPAGSPAGVCSVAMTDTTLSCCPVSITGVPPPPSPSPQPPTAPPPMSPPFVPSVSTRPPPDTPPANPQSPPPEMPPPPPSPAPPSPAPPSPAPPSPPPPCVSCISLKLTPPAIDVVPYRFSPAACASLQAMMATQLNDQAAAPGSGTAMPMLRNYTVDPALCEPLQVSVCGEFFSADDGAALALWADQQAAFWLNTLTGSGATCSAALDGYGVTVSSGGGTCPYLEKSVSCAPPPDINPFPNCKCNRTRGTTPFTASPYAFSERGRSTNTMLYCFVVNVLGPDNIIPNSCGSASKLVKLEFWADDTKSRALTGINLRPTLGNSTWITPAWATKGDNSVKATPLNWSLPQANGGKVCLELVKTVTLGDFCMGPAPNQCYISFFNTDRNCCPIYRSEVIAPSP